MFLFKIGLSRLISKLSLISSTNLLFPFAKMVNTSKDGILLQFKRWLRIALSFDGLVFLNVKGDVPICSLDVNFKVSIRLTIISRTASTTGIFIYYSRHQIER